VAVSYLAQTAMSGADEQHPTPGPGASAATLTGPLSRGQQALWFLDRLAPGHPAYVVAGAALVRGAADVPALRRALAVLLRRHPALSARFREGGDGPVQEIALAPVSPETPEIPASLEAPAEVVEEVFAGSREAFQERLGEIAYRPFDLARGPLLRVAAVSWQGRGAWALLLAVHHIAADFWSIGILLRDLGALLAGRRLPGAPAVLHLDWVLDQEDWLEGPEARRQWDFWRDALAGFPLALELPTDRPRPAAQGSAGASLPLRLPADLTQGIYRLAQQLAATPFAVLLGMFQALLGRLSGQERLLVGVPTFGRGGFAPGPAEELAGVVGYFVNPLPLPGDLSRNPTAAELLGRVWQSTLAALARDGLPFALLAESLQPERDGARSPVFQVMFSFQSGRSPEEEALAALTVGESDVPLELGGLAATTFALPVAGSQFDLSLALTRWQGELVGRWVFSTDLFDAATLARWSGHLQSLLAAAAATPQARIWELPLLAPPERHQLLVEWGRSAGVEPESPTLHGLVEAQAARTPGAPAVVFEDEALSYGELDARADRLARRLRALGVGPEARVGVCAERSPELVVALLAVLKAGGAYVPLDPSYPRERLAYMVEDSGACLLLVQAALAGDFQATAVPQAALNGDLGGEEEDTESLSDRSPGGVLPEHPAYLLYTSGSTGRPKGVVVSHRSAAHRVAYAARVDLTPADAFLQKTAISFDVSVLEIFAPLACGARTVLPRPGGQGDTAYLLRLIAEQGVTHASFPPSTLAVLLAEGHLAACRTLRIVITGGETVPGELAARFHERMPAAGLLNRYGPTEATISVTSWLCRRQDGDRRPPIGRPLGGAEVVLLDRRGELVPPGVPGEICLGGVCLARGYWARPDLTAERFVPRGFDGGPGERLYRSGDLARFRPDGALEFVGRVDRQVKIRGFRVELGEIEAALGALPGVREAVVLAAAGGAGRAGQAGDLQLVAYVVPIAGGSAREVTAGDLRAALAERLPGYMMPAVFVALDELPLTPTGKVDRQALAERERSARPRPEPPGAGATALRTSTEELLAGIWEGLFGGDRAVDEERSWVGRKDHFFALGGHSLLAAQLVSRVRQALAVELPLRAVFEAPVLEELARKVDEARAESSPALPALEPLARTARMAQTEQTGALPVSFAQERLWVLDRLAPGGAVYNMPGAVHLRGSLDVPALQSALAAVVRRHEALRTTFPAPDGRPVQRIGTADLPSSLPIPPLLPVVDLSALPPDARSQERCRLEAAAAARPFGLAAGPVLRCALLRLAEGEHRLVVVFHHIAVDGWSIGIFLREWTELYGAAVEDRPAGLAPLPVQYADFAAWQRRSLSAEVLAGRLAAWRERLDGAPTVLELPADRPRTAAGSGRGGAVPVTIPAARVDRLAGLARGEVATLFMALLAVFDVLLWRSTGQASLLVGTPVAGRDRVEIEDLIGLFVETRVLRADVRGEQSFRGLLAETRAGVLADQDRPAVPFGQLVEALAPRESRGRRPLVQVMLAFHEAPLGRIRLPGVEAEIVALESGAAKLDLTLDLARREDGGLVGALEYDRDLFDAATAGRLAGHFQVLLEGALADPEMAVERLPLLAGAERHQLLVEWSGSHCGQPGPSGASRGLSEVVFQVESEAVAVVCQDGTEVAYGELARRVEGMARRLRRRGVGPEVVVGVLAERSLDQVVALLGVLRAGGVYLPLDPSLPDTRLAFLLEDSGAAVVLAPAAEAGRVPPGQAAVLILGKDPGEEEAVGAPVAGRMPPGRAAVPGGEPREEAEEGPMIDLASDDHLAYLIFTSGSTGVPKAVGVSRRALADHLGGIVAALGLGPADRVLQFGSPSFDVALEQTLGTFVAGAALVLRGPELWAPSELSARCAALGLTVMDLPTAYWAQWVREHGDEALPPGLALRLVLVGGEAMPPDAVRRWARSPLGRVGLVNAYGPTEAVITATMSQPAAEPYLETAPIGRALAGRTVYVLGGGALPLDLLPCGRPGELCLGGLLARGYLRRPDLTAERFVPDPSSEVPGARLYRTGDVGRFRTDGQLELLGRIDGQVKVRGFRIELGEVEAALRSLPGVREAVAVVRPEVGGSGARLLAYFVAAEGIPVDPAALRSTLRSRLPEFMVPAACVELAVLPLTPAGKVDRRALAERGPLPARNPPRSEAPSTPAEEALAEIWGQVLETRGIGIHDDFFDLGGNSLQATQVLLRIREAFGVELPVRTFFDQPTIAAVALALAELLAAGLNADQLAGVLAEME
jgi:amino acid adenylation domain-containing protein